MSGIVKDILKADGTKTLDLFEQFFGAADGINFSHDIKLDSLNGQFGISDDKTAFLFANNLFTEVPVNLFPEYLVVGGSINYMRSNYRRLRRFLINQPQLFLRPMCAQWVALKTMALARITDLNSLIVTRQRVEDAASGKLSGAAKEIITHRERGKKPTAVVRLDADLVSGSVLARTHTRPKKPIGVSEAASLVERNFSSYIEPFKKICAAYLVEHSALPRLSVFSDMLAQHGKKYGVEDVLELAKGKKPFLDDEGIYTDAYFAMRILLSHYCPNELHAFRPPFKNGASQNICHR